MRKIILVVFVLAFLNSFMLIKNENKPKENKGEIIFMSNFKYSGKLLDAGIPSEPLDTTIQRKMKNIKWESDKYR